MIDSNFLDSSIWINYFAKENHKDIINSGDILLTSVLSLFEIKKKFSKDNIDETKINLIIEFIKKRSLVIPVDAKIAEKAVEFSIKNKMPMADAIIYASAILNNCIVITLDNHFKGLDKAVLI